MEDSELKMITLEEVVKGSSWLESIDKLKLNMEEKLKMIQTAIECPTEYIQLFEELIKVIEERLHKRYRRHRVKAYGFGSFLTGLALKNCDLDLYVEFDPLPSPQLKVLKMMKSAFYSCDFRDVFKKVFLIPAKVPILRCEHVIGFQCDVSVCNPLARHNSELIKFYLSLNERFRLFFLLVKLWVRRIGLLGSNNFRSYTLTMLLIYYLQQKQLVPSVATLQRHPLNPSPRLVAGWDSSFLSDTNFYFYDKELSILELLTDFFAFYSEFEFGFYVISPFLGDKVLKPFDQSVLFNFSNKADCVFNDNAFVCVQDCFQHDFNTAGNIPMQGIIDFQSHCQRAAALCDKDQSGNLKCSLKAMFETREVNTKKRKKTSAGSCVLCVGNTRLPAGSEDEQRQAWLSQILKNVEEILKVIGLVEVVQKDGNVLMCETKYRAYNMTFRKKVGQTLAPQPSASEPPPPDGTTVPALPPLSQLTPFERQKAISAAIKKLDNETLLSPFRFLIRYFLRQRPTRLNFEVTSIPSENSHIDQILSFERQFNQWLSLLNG